MMRSKRIRFISPSMLRYQQPFLESADLKLRDHFLLPTHYLQFAHRCYANVYVRQEYQQKYKNSGLSGDVIEELAKAMDQLMQQEKLYRESELKLETLAHKLGVARHYVSQVINQHYGINFFEYINHLRIKEAQQILMNPANQSMNIIEVAYEVGFNTKNTFNAAFRRITGITPTAFRNQNKTRLN